MARAFRKRVKPRPLQKMDLVLRILRGLVGDPREKFRPSWSGPYVIQELTPEGATWLIDLDETSFQSLPMWINRRSKTFEIMVVGWVTIISVSLTPYHLY